jgi:hypothetical protein
VGVTAEDATAKNAKGEETFVAGDAVIARGMDAAIHEGYRMGVRI